MPFFSGEFDDPNYDDVNNPTSQAGITCTSCHAITNVNDTRGNASYTIEEPQHYPFAFSDDPLLQWINNSLVKAKPEMHKKTFFKPILKDAKFCSTCHKVGLPVGVTHYKDFVRGQNHYDTYLLSGVSGHGARSFYYPEVAKSNCNECHMELKASNDFGAKDFDGKGGREIHDHLFAGANTGLAALLGNKELVERHARFLSDKKVRIDIFGLRKGGVIDGELLGPIRPDAPVLKPDSKYLVEVVVRTLGIGHPFSQGTVDSNEIWVELIASSGGRVIGRSGGMGPDGAVDPYSHFINIYMLDRKGNRIDRRNPQDIFVPLYNKQIPPGAGQVVHFALEVPRGATGPITLEAKINYRKFDRTYLDYIYGKGKGPTLPVVVMARDQVQLGIEGGPPAVNEPSPIQPVWQRWNDYGIGLLLEGGNIGGQKGELKQAEPVFLKVAELGAADGWVNLGRVYQKEGRIPEALAALEKAAKHEKPAAPWVINWLSGQINARNGAFDEAIASFQSVLDTKVPDRKIDLSLDYEVNNELAFALYARAMQERSSSPERLEYLKKAVAAYRRTLSIDSENITAHHALGLAYGAAPWGENRAASANDEETGAGAKEAEPIDADALIKLAATAVDQNAPRETRLSAARRLPREIARFVDGPRPLYQSRLAPLFELVETLSPAWDKEADTEIFGALTRALEVTHERLHERLKPDETAEGQVFAIARKNPAADANAQSIVIHSLHRAGAPGHRGRNQAAPRPLQRRQRELRTPHTWTAQAQPQHGRAQNERRSHHRLLPDSGLRGAGCFRRLCPAGGAAGDCTGAVAPVRKAAVKSRNVALGEVRGHHQGRRDLFRALQRRSGRETPARDHGGGRGVPRLRPRRRPGPVLRQLVLLAAVTKSSRHPPRRFTATTARATSRMSPRRPASTRRSTVRESPSATMTTTATPISTSRQSAADISFATTAKGTSKKSRSKREPEGRTAG